MPKRKSKAPWIIGLVALATGATAYFAFFRGDTGAGEIEYRYAPVVKGELIRSISANGTLVPLTRVDVKSKAGGKVVRLYVDEGSVVRAGDLIAEIDPSDTRSVFEQAQADVNAAQARVSQAMTNADLQQRTVQSNIEDAEIALELARIRLQRAEEESRRQPALTNSDQASAEASVRSAEAALRNLRDVEAPQRRRDAEGQAAQAKSNLDAARADYERQQRLFDRGFVARSVVERAKATLDAAQASYDTASQRLETLEAALRGDIEAQESQLASARAARDRSRANANQVVISEKALEEARRQVRQAEIAVKEAQDARLNVSTRRDDVQSAEASAVRSRVAMQNAREQLDSTRVLAPRDGVVTTKYLEEGTIIPPGTSTFSEGTSIVEISDTTTMFAECQVDETDIGNVQLGQRVRIVIEAYPGRSFNGIVRKIFPAATTNQAITSVRVRVEILPEESPAAGGGPGGMPGRIPVPSPQPAPPEATPRTAQPGQPETRPEGQRPGGQRPDGERRRMQRPDGETGTPTPGAPQRGGMQAPNGQATPGGGRVPQASGQAEPVQRPDSGARPGAPGAGTASPGGSQAPGQAGMGRPGGAPGGAAGGRGGRGGPVILRPGMNATCEFLTFEKQDVLIVPSQAVKREEGTVFVLVKTNDPKRPTRRVIKTGETGNQGTEVTEGLKEGEEVVVAEIDLAALRERQERMQQSQGAAGGGLTGGRPTGPSPSRATGGGGR